MLLPLSLCDAGASPYALKTSNAIEKLRPAFDFQTTMQFSGPELFLVQWLRDAPKKYGYRYEEEARAALLHALFSSLGCHRREYLTYFFPNGVPTEHSHTAWKLSAAQGAAEGAEYSAGARGKPCGHIFKTGEATYRCK